MNKFLKHNKPKERSCGLSKHKCSRCLRSGGHISKYGIHLCRLCFREIAVELGFKKYS
ncbi:30S ribosomal protein S14 [Candidatus Woesearchaeota archaeon]|nr:30S ribosomal protein S14 [Candidatus Woesearchaeota archaeon]